MILPEKPNSPLKNIEGILLVDKPEKCTSFSLVAALRRKLNVRKIGHAGTLDPFATGVMVMLIGKNYTRLSNQFLCQDKEYIATIELGTFTDTYDCEGIKQFITDVMPSELAVHQVLQDFQGEVEQIPPMFSAKKIAGKKLYDLARKGITVERKAVRVNLETSFLSYAPPYLTLKITCSKGTYIRSIAHDLGIKLGCGAHLMSLRRTRSGIFSITDCFNGSLLYSPETTADLISQSILLDRQLCLTDQNVVETYHEKILGI